MQPRLRPIGDIATGQRHRKPEHSNVEAPQQGTKKGVHFAYCNLCSGCIADENLSRVKRWRDTHALIHASKGNLRWSL
jgi:hypothetical protein